MQQKMALAIILTAAQLLSGCSDDNDKKSTAPYSPVILDNPPAYIGDQTLTIARRWNEVLLDAIRHDFARPTIHARNLFHLSAAGYDSWALYNNNAESYLFAKDAHSACQKQFDTTQASPVEREQAIEKTLSYAVYRLLHHRFSTSPGAEYSLALADTMMAALAYDIHELSTVEAQAGRQIADCYIAYGLDDGSNESNAYANRYYQSINPPLFPKLTGNPDIINLNRWQPLSFEGSYIDQSGNTIENGDTPEFLGPEWGNVKSFALTDADMTLYQRDNNHFRVYHDPATPPLLNSETAKDYQWGFSLVAAWSAHLSPDDNIQVDISPASIGNIQNLPENYADYAQFYALKQGGDSGEGYPLNPITGQAYTPQYVPRGDYARVLAEFWADGPDSETPPGHWFVLLNAVSDHPLVDKRFQGQGPELPPLEWDVKAYFTLGAAMHDAAISAWSIKGWYDYIRPISAIRAMADLGQSSDSSADNYHANGLLLIPGLIETVTSQDPLAGTELEHVGKIKLKAWRGPRYIIIPERDEAGVDWILAEQWWPYQRPSFITPPFAGYVSGHSTFSRAAAEVLGAFTGDEYFPGGISSFEVKKNAFLVFEQGPSVDMSLQWARYIDASDQCSLSRIWGGIHPPADDIPGRIIGKKVGMAAFTKASQYFSGAQ